MITWVLPTEAIKWLAVVYSYKDQRYEYPGEVPLSEHNTALKELIDTGYVLERRVRHFDGPLYVWIMTLTEKGKERFEKLDTPTRIRYYMDVGAWGEAAELIAELPLEQLPQFFVHKLSFIRDAARCSAGR